MRALIALFLLAGCPAIFQTDHVPRARPGATFEIDLQMLVTYGGFEVPYVCVEVPDAWSIAEVTYDGTSTAQTVPISGTAVLDATATDVMAGNFAQPGFTWSCFAGPQDSYDYTDTGIATVVVQSDQTTGVFPIRVANGSTGGGVPFMEPLTRRIAIGDLNHPLDDWISADTDLLYSTVRGMAYGAGLFVGSTTDGNVLNSSDGLTWTSSLAIPYGIQRVRHTGGMFVAVGDNLAVSTSTDGVHWSVGPPIGTGLPPPRYHDVAFGSGLYVIPRDDGRIAYSADTLTWTATDTPAVGGFAALRGIAYGAGRFVAVGGAGFILHSTNGTAWTDAATGTFINFEAVAYGNGLFVAGGEGEVLMVSSDGISWRPVTIPTFPPGVQDIAFGNGVFAAVSGISHQVYTSSDAASWTARELATHAFLESIAFGADQFAVGGLQGYIARSPTPRGQQDGPIDLGDVSVDAPQTAIWTIRSSGPGRLALGTVQLEMTPGFSLAEDLCTGATLEPGTSCAISIFFAPSMRGPVSAAISIPTNDPDQPQLSTTISAVGVGPIPDIAIAPATHDFGTIAVGMTSVPQSFTVSNEGDGDLSIASVLADGPFSVLNDECSLQDVAPAGTCTFDAMFAPTAAGAATGGVEVTSNDPDEPFAGVSLIGTGAGGPTPSIVITDSLAPPGDSSVPFGELVPGTTARATVTVANAGDAALSIRSITGAAAPFSIADDACSNTELAQAETCTFMLVFAPTAAGVFQSTVSVPSNDPDPTPMLAVTGRASDKAVCSSSPPTAPKLVKPENNAKDVATPVTFGWEESSDPEDDRITYELFVCESANFAGCDATSVAFRFSAPRWMIAPMLLTLTACSNQADKEKEVDLKKGTTYFWKVAALDDTGCRTDSEVRSFTTAE